MAKVTKANDCGAPKLKQLPAEFAQQVTIDAGYGGIITTVLRASLPELAKLVAKGGGYHNSTNGVVKALNFATSLDLKAAQITEDWSGYHASGFEREISDAGIARTWKVSRGECGGYDETMNTSDLYEPVEAEVHVVFVRKLKDKKYLTSKGVK